MISTQVRALDGPVVRARVSPRRRLSAHLGALAARGAEATRAGVAGASRYVAPSMDPKSLSKPASCQNRLFLIAPQTVFTK